MGVLVLSLLQVEKARMRTGFKNALHFKSNSLYVRDLDPYAASFLSEIACLCSVF